MTTGLKKGKRKKNGSHFIHGRYSVPEPTVPSLLSAILQQAFAVYHECFLVQKLPDCFEFERREVIVLNKRQPRRLSPAWSTE